MAAAARGAVGGCGDREAGWTETTGGEVWGEHVGLSGAGVMERISSSALMGVILTTGAAIGDRRSKSYKDKSMSPKISSVVAGAAGVGAGAAGATGTSAGEQEGASVAAVLQRKVALTDVTSASVRAATAAFAVVVASAAAAAGESEAVARGRSSCSKRSEGADSTAGDAGAGVGRSGPSSQTSIADPSSSVSSSPELKLMDSAVQLEAERA